MPGLLSTLGDVNRRARIERGAGQTRGAVCAMQSGERASLSRGVGGSAGRAYQGAQPCSLLCRQGRAQAERPAVSRMQGGPPQPVIDVQLAICEMHVVLLPRPAFESARVRGASAIVVTPSVRTQQR